jgi:hypothetical protein
MRKVRLHAPLAGVLLCLLVPGGCEQPSGSVGVTQLRQEPTVLTEPPATPPAAPAAPPDEPAAAAESHGKKLTLESLVLTPEDTPFTAATPHNFGAVTDADWLAATPRRTTQKRLLPDLFVPGANQERVDVEGELLLDDNQQIYRVVDGVGVKLKISTD